MGRHLLIPTDLSDKADRAADTAHDLIGPGPTRVTLLHVIETIPGASYEDFESFYRELETRTESRLAALAARLETWGFAVDQSIVYGEPAEEIVRFAMDQRVDLIIMTSHRIDPSQPGRGWSTLSYRVGVLAPCPVLLVK